MTRLDRALQLDLLQKISDEYPGAIRAHDGLVDFHDPAVKFNLQYLKEHGLIHLDATLNIDTNNFSIRFARATNDGLDFLQQDGGLSAVLKVTTVRLHEDTIRGLIAARIKASDLPAERKDSLLERLKQLPAQSIERLADKLLDQALAKAPDAIEWISTLLR
ncbi:hypothetical protein [Ramlibacter sp. Leaf400]|uniref:hypothetical protein n=1 Tax=Ramlibacter sp. Leaf400 TaxID=1736365 RepID=UPI0006FF1FAD|nr:hypothetical protein [Ramlibacter sp. Leaf400]KQT10982.1 hypothetical protein ASG30_09290 [Ramlibacter sp. Leaf400]